MRDLDTALRAEAIAAREYVLELDDMARAMGMASADDDAGLSLSKQVTLARARRIETVLASGDVVAMIRVAADEGLATVEEE